MPETTLAVVPDQTYHFDDYKCLYFREIPEAVRQLRAEIDAEYRQAPASHFQRIIEAARPPVEKGGAPYAIFEDADSSPDTAMVVPLPYCNPIIPDIMDPTAVAAALRQRQAEAFDSNTWNNGEKHLFLFKVMKALGIRDEAGKTIPVIAVPGDSPDYHPRLSRHEKAAVVRGDLEPYVNGIENILNYTGHGRLHIGGYSQGASVAHEFAAWAGNFDIASLTLAEAPTYKDRSALALAKNYLLNKPVPGGKADSKPEIKWTAAGPESRRDLEQIQNRSFTTMLQTIALHGGWRAALALRHATMGIDLAVAIDRRGHFPLTVAWNETSSLTHDIEEKFLAPDAPDRTVIESFRAAGRLRLVKALGQEAVGAPHLAGESPMYYSLLFGESVQWAAEQA